MPRKAPTQVTEHRVTFGDLERSQLIPLIEESRAIIKSKKTAQTISNVQQSVLTGFIGVGALGVGIAGYAAYEWVTGSSLISNAGDWLDTQRRRLSVRKGEPTEFKDSNGNEVDSLGIFWPFNEYISWLP
ncbi:MAG: hypothetical protein [Circular genetic element sp.]|nr:MAG: hypothetical protein [Circular genetic element sp.]